MHSMKSLRGHDATAPSSPSAALPSLPWAKKELGKTLEDEVKGLVKSCFACREDIWHPATVQKSVSVRSVAFVIWIP